MWRVTWYKVGESEARNAYFSHEDDARSYLAALMDCGFKCGLVHPRNTETPRPA